MKRQHPSWQGLFAELRAGELSGDVVMEFVLHLLDLCPECERTFRAYSKQHQADEDESPYAEAFEAAREIAGSAVPQMKHELRRARRELVNLLECPPQERRLRIHRARTNYRSPFLVDLLLSECRRCVVNDPDRALDLAECAHDVALRIPANSYSDAWILAAVARSNAHRGNALRAAGETVGAAPLVEFGLQLYRQQALGDPYLEAELLSLLTSLRKDQRRFDEASVPIAQIAEIFEEIEDASALGRVRVQESDLFKDAGDPERALQAAELAIAALHPQEDRELYLGAQHNRALCLAELERYEEARDCLLANEMLYQAFPGQLIQVRLQWLFGVVARGLGQLQEAEATLRSTRQRFLDRGLVVDAALVGLDLALVLIEAGEPAKVREVAEEVVPVFRAQKVERDTIAALLLFEEAARQSAVTVTMVQDLARVLRQVPVRR